MIVGCNETFSLQAHFWAWGDIAGHHRGLLFKIIYFLDLSSTGRTSYPSENTVTRVLSWLCYAVFHYKVLLCWTGTSTEVVPKKYQVVSATFCNRKPKNSELSSTMQWNNGLSCHCRRPQFNRRSLFSYFSPLPGWMFSRTTEDRQTLEHRNRQSE